MDDATAALVLALSAENAELRAQLAAAQDMLVETAIDAGRLHARIGELQAERDALRVRAHPVTTEKACAPALS